MFTRDLGKEKGTGGGGADGQVSCDAGPVTASVTPAGSSGTRKALQGCPEFCTKMARFGYSGSHQSTEGAHPQKAMTLARCSLEPRQTPKGQRAENCPPAALLMAGRATHLLLKGELGLFTSLCPPHQGHPAHE